MHVHLVGVCGTGMGSLAALLCRIGHRVTGSDVRFDPPMGDVLRAAGVTCLEGYGAQNLSRGVDLVVVGNVIRRDNPEAVAVEAQGLRRASMSATLRECFLVGRRPLVVTGTHGKTTTASMCAWVLREAGFDPGYFIGGVPKGLPESAAIGRSDARGPFVVEGDEYDAVYWHKQPKFFDYVGVGEDDVAILTSVEHDHIDIYPTEASYDAVFVELAGRVPRSGLLMCNAADRRAVAAARRCGGDVAYYALEGDDTGDVKPGWIASVRGADADGNQPFELRAGGTSCGRFELRVPGRHNVRNATAALAACASGWSVPMEALRTALSTFQGVKRRQDLVGHVGGVRVYDDFAHHPTAVDETLRALRSRHPEGRLWAIFEPRSATACRALHQEAYARAFDVATFVVLAPLGRAQIASSEALDLPRLVRDIGPRARLAANGDAIVDAVAREAASGDTVAVLSNGAFGGVPHRIVAALAERAREGGAP